MPRLVIDISENMYQRIVKTPRCTELLDAIKDRNEFIKTIQKGILLPKGHGDLIDRNALDRECDKLGWWEDTDEFAISPMRDILFDAPTIIEADKENKE